MSIDDSGVVKVVRDRIVSAAFHPASSSLLMAAGNIWGQLGLLKMVSQHIQVEFVVNINCKVREVDGKSGCVSKIRTVL